jgi:hypothetical protein
MLTATAASGMVDSNLIFSFFEFELIDSVDLEDLEAVPKSAADVEGLLQSFDFLNQLNRLLILNK